LDDGESVAGARSQKMKKNNWEKVENIFHTTLDLPLEERKTYLQKVCAGDGKLFSEVESLISSLEKESEFLDEPVFELGLAAIHKNEQKSFTGKTIGFYELQEKIGSGGMGEVYKAFDTKLNRRVALKFLCESMEDDRAAKRRLAKEAQAAAALEHPNICAVHGIEQTDEHHFIVMQYIEGKTLAEIIEKEIIDVEAFKSLARQILTAVAFAHSHGIIHRDLKPGNIMLTGDGHIKVLDFGLAKVIHQKQFFESENDNKSNFSQNGLVIGTVSYMSPEQLRGEKIDYQSDIFSVGIILYELLTKKNPFSRKSQAETIAAILTDAPPALEKTAANLPANLRNLVEKCLEKNPERRFQSASEILVELDKAEIESLPETAANRSKLFFVRAVFVAVILLALFVGYYFYNSRPVRRTLAVLPILIDKKLSAKEYLANGLTQSITEKLSNLSDLKVENQYRVARYKGQPFAPQEIGKELKVDAVYVGSIIERNEELFLTAKIIRTIDGAVIDEIESKIEEEKLNDLLESISAYILHTINTNLTDEDKIMFAKKDTNNSEARDLYFLGRYYLERKAGDDLKKAIEAFTKAKELDPLFAKAWTGLADSSLSLSLPGAENPISPHEAANTAKAAVKRAFELDKSLAETYNSQGMISLKYDWKWTEAEGYFRTAVNLNPEFIPARVGLINVLNIQGRFDESLQEVQKIKEIDPLSILPYLEIAKINYRRYDFEQMDTIFSEMFEKFPDNKARISYMQSYQFMQTGKFEEAIAILEKIYESGKESDKVFASAPLGFAYARTKQENKALELINNLERIAKKHYVPSQEKAIIYIGLGDFDKAFENLNKSCRERYSTLPALLNDPLIDEIKADARFFELKKCANL
jgi:serine/threonine protein kinase